MKRNSVRISRVLLSSTIIIIVSFSLINCSGDENNPTTSTINYGTIDDIDGNSYKTVQIGTQWWMAENLKVTHYRDGQPIPNVTDSTDWSTISTGAYCFYKNISSNMTDYGLLYNWYAATNNPSIAPEGWHIPTDEDWKKLEMHLGMNQTVADESDWRGTNQGGKLKATGTTYWQYPNSGATNESGFSALPGGGRSGYAPYQGNFYYKGTLASIWTSSEYNLTKAWFRDISYNKSNIYRSTIFKRNGFSIRCVKD